MLVPMLSGTDKTSDDLAYIMVMEKIDKKIVGSSAVLNEIGSHAYHLAIYISGLKGDKIFADIKNFSEKISQQYLNNK